MSIYDRTSVVQENFLSFLDSCSPPDGSVPPDDAPVDPDASLTWGTAKELFYSQLASRQLDYTAREMKRDGTGYYTIASAGHEGNAAVAEAMETTDPSIVHYRSGAFMMHRLFRASGHRPLEEFTLSLTASSEDPVSAGRHKVFGDADTFVPPQTSTIASHLPRAVGMAFGMDHGSSVGHELPVPEDAILCCSFGDASVNHTVFQGALNSILWAVHRGLPVPILLLCEDNGLGISVPTPEGWIEESMSNRTGLTYMSCDGGDLTNTYKTTREALEHIRSTRSPVFLHMNMVRLLGHSGADIEQEYRSMDDIKRDEAQDPLLQTASWLIENRVLTPDEVESTYRSFGEEIRNLGEKASSAPKLSTPEEVMAPLQMPDQEPVNREARRSDYREKRLELFGGAGELPEEQDRTRTMARLLNQGLADMLAKYDEMMLFGEDVARKGGVYYITQGLREKAGPHRVFDTLLDETTILGLGLGLGTWDMLPVPEIQYLAYVYNAYDQLRGESTSLPFFSDGQFSNGMVVRVQSFAYQGGIGGHFHNDNGIAALREIPGITIAVPSRGDDAVEMLRTAMALAHTADRVVLFLEPIALYHEKHLYETGDSQWTHRFPEPGEAVSVGEPRVYRDQNDADLTILTYGNGVHLSLNASRAVEQRENVSIRVVDLRWLKPLPQTFLQEEARRNHSLLVVDECRERGGPGEEITNILYDVDESVQVKHISARDSFVPLGPAADEVLVTEEDIRDSIRSLLNR